jgi:YHS domain-containing protein
MAMAMRKEFCEHADQCDVCQKPLQPGDACVTEEVLGGVHTFCSETCRAEFVKDPSRYHQEEEPLE